MAARSEPDRRLTKQRAVSSKLPSSSSPLPIAQTIAILHKWGIHTLGQLAALDKEELRARLGPEAVRLWERANGTATRLLKFIQHQTFHSGATLHLDRSRAKLTPIRSSFEASPTPL